MGQIDFNKMLHRFSSYRPWLWGMLSGRHQKGHCGWKDEDFAFRKQNSKENSHVVYKDLDSHTWLHIRSNWGAFNTPCAQAVLQTSPECWDGWGSKALGFFKLSRLFLSAASLRINNAEGNILGLWPISTSRYKEDLHLVSQGSWQLFREHYKYFFWW